MENCEERPRPGAPPILNSDLETLEYLLNVERNRLEVAVRIEAERRIVFPETTVIIRDIQKLLAAIERCRGGDQRDQSDCSERYGVDLEL